MQLTTLAKKSYKGFTLIELLVVIAIIGLLSTIVAAPVQSARKKAKDTKKIAEIKQLTTALSSYANDNGQFPTGANLTGLIPTYMPALPTSLSSSVPAPRDHTMYVAYSSFPVGAAGSTSADYKTFGYHLGVTLEVYNPVLADDDDCWGVVSVITASSSNSAGLKTGSACELFTSSASTSLNIPSYVGSATSPVTGTPITTVLNGITPTAVSSSSFTFSTNYYVPHPMWNSSTSDFQGRGISEVSTSTCPTVDSCIFDVSDAY